jgi:hypothetical protein
MYPIKISAFAGMTALSLDYDTASFAGEGGVRGIEKES